MLLFPAVGILFPDERLPGPRWRAPIAACVVALGIGTILQTIAPWPLEGDFTIPNPLAVAGVPVELFELGAGVAAVGSFVLFGIAVAAVVVRLRRSSGVERAQQKWLVASTVTMAIAFPVSFATDLRSNPWLDMLIDLTSVLTGALVPIAVGVAILRYHVFEIDRIVSRTIAYVVITALLVTAYAASIVLLLGPLEAFTDGDTLAVALSTLGGRRALPSRPASRPGARRSSVRPGPLRRRADDRRLLRAVARRGRHHDGHGRSRPNGPVGTQADPIIAVAAGQRGPMIRRSLIRVVAVASIAICVVVAIIDGLRGWPSGGFYVLYGAIAIVFVVVGWLIAERQPRNLVGPLLLAFGSLFALYLPADQYLRLPGNPPAAEFAALFISILDAPMFILVALVLILFPDGRPPSPRWRWAIGAGVLGIGLTIGGYLADAAPFALFPLYRSPLGIAGFPGQALVYAAYSIMLVLLLAAVAALVARWRRGSLVERAQIKWVVAAAVVALATEIVNVATFKPEAPDAITTTLASVGIALIPVAMGIAILRYHLYDIDRIISRTLAYAVVLGILGVVFAGGILLLQAVLARVTQGETIAVAASTLAVFALFQPVLRRVRHAVDRRFDRAAYDAERTVSSFAERLRSETDMETVSAELLTTVRGAIAPAAVGMWLRAERGER